MLTFVAAALIGQVYAVDYNFMEAQENWVIDNRPQGMGYQWMIPKAVRAQVEMWFDPCARCQMRAVDEITAMGPDAIRPMMWTVRARDKGVAYYSELVLNRLRRCTVCKGSGNCPGFEGEQVSSASCKNCISLEYFHHSENFRSDCLHCGGRGYDMRKPGDF